MAITPRFGFTIEYVKDIAAARRFYVDVIGLRVEREHPVFVQFEHFALATDADESLQGTAEPTPETYWLVDDAEAAYRELAPRAKVAVPLKELPFGRVFALEDPDGRSCFLLELAQSRPSRVV